MKPKYIWSWYWKGWIGKVDERFYLHFWSGANGNGYWIPMRLAKSEALITYHG